MRYELIVVGGSLGGFRALEGLLGRLPEEFPLPLAIAQHRSSDGTTPLLQSLQRVSSLPVIEVEDKQKMEPGTVYVAPADYHLLIEDGYFALSTAAPVLAARPSIDVLFESAADAYGARAIAILLSGSSNDGARGISAIKESGGIALIQEPASAQSAVMPLAAISAAPVDRVLPLNEIAPFLCDLVADGLEKVWNPKRR